ncbi:unnamed protein product [Paramecium primaurelia]|uniref:Uncharacterized protein n=1 Tax=Paramecium primaurelia TaxID=5886 RepID=A0A8S1PU17_PARPR|nr:unnamed protein product [Paramecium primaurelia]
MSNYSCQFCYKRTTLGYIKNYFPCEINLHKMIRHTLYHKYATSQNYYYTKDINEILSKTSTARTILYNDYLCYDEEDEYIKRFYEIHEYPPKSKLLTEFYKFHKDLPRWVLKQTILKILNYYYDKRRKIEFYKIQRQIEIENQMNPTDPPKGIVGDKPLLSDSTPQSENSEPQSKVNVDNILKEISFSNKKPQPSSEISRILQVPESPPIGEIQQMISLLNLKSDSPNQKQQYQWFKKKKNQSKKSLKLDELALSLSARTHQNPQEAKMPLSARYQQSYSNRLIDQIQSKLYNKHSQTISRDKILDFKQNKEQFIKKFKLEDKNKKSNSPKKSDQNKAIQEIKQLELKIIKSLQEMKNIKSNNLSNHESKQIPSQNQNNNNQVLSLDQKALYQILKIPDSFRQLNFNKLQNKTNSKRSQDQNQRQQKNNNNSSQNQKQVQILDMKKLISNKKDIAPKTERVKKTIPSLNLNLIGAINQSTSMTTRNNSFTPSLAYAQLLTPKQNQTNIYNENIINNWQQQNTLNIAIRENNIQK